MTSLQKRALRFAYRLLRGDYKDEYLPYVHRSVPRSYAIQQGLWIEPDQDPERPFLNEDTFTALVMRGYFERAPFDPTQQRTTQSVLESDADPIWLYRLTRQGCVLLGWDWPLEPKYKLAPGRKPNRAMVRYLSAHQQQNRDRNSWWRNFDPRSDLHVPPRTNAWRRR